MKNTIYIYMDDSGKMSKNEKCFSFGGVYFINRENRDNFKRIYKSFIETNKCLVCKKIKCDKNCIELKSNNSSSKFKRRVINLMKNKEDVKTFSITVFNKNINSEIFSNRHSKGRRLDYYQKIIVKQIIKDLLKSKVISKYDNLDIILNIDEAKTASSGIYNLKESIYEELKFGIVNFNYSANFPPIIKGNLSVEINFVNSSKNFLVQSADFLVGYVNSYMLWDKEDKLKIDTKIIL